MLFSGVEDFYPVSISDVRHASIWLLIKVAKSEKLCIQNHEAMQAASYCAQYTYTRGAVCSLVNMAA